MSPVGAPLKGTPPSEMGGWVGCLAGAVLSCVMSLQGTGDLPCFVPEPRVGDLFGKGTFCKVGPVEVPVDLVAEGILGRPLLEVVVKHL